MKLNFSKIPSIVRWFFGLTFLMMGASYLTSHFVAAITAVALSSLLIPPFAKLIFSKIKKTVPTWSKVVLGIFLLGIFGANVPSTEKTPPSNSNTPTVGITPTPTPGTQVSFYSVAKIVDGDTIQIDIDGKSQVIRLIGVDTPESVDPRKPVQCFASEATKKAKEVLTGKKVSIESDETQGDKDKYNRQLRYVFLEDGTNFSKLMISEGYAHEYTYSTPYKYMEEFKQAEKEARENKKGLWADDACPAPTTTPSTAITPIPKTQTPTPTPTIYTQPRTGGYSCGSKTKCGEMTSCAEAMYYLNSCGVSRLDGDKDGVPCETLCN